MSDSLRPHESQNASPPCPSPTPRDYSNSCPWSQWCHQAIWSSVIPFSSCPQSLPASGSFPTSQLFSWGGQSIGVSASVSVLPMNTQDWSPLGWLVGSPCSPWDSQESSPTPQFKSINSSLNIQKTKIMAFGPITSWQIDGETMETVTDFILGGSKISPDGDCSHEIKRHLLLGRKAMANLDSILKSRDITLPERSI